MKSGTMNQGTFIFALVTAGAMIAPMLSGCASNESAAKANANMAATLESGTEHLAITTDKLELYECGTIKRLHTYGGIFLASQPQPADFAQAKKGGVKTVINLRNEDENKAFNERQIVEDEGLTYVSVPWDGPDELTDAVFDQSRELFKTAQRPILMHCSSGNRVGALWLPYRVLDGGLSWDAALAEAKEVGLRSPDYEAKAKDYIARHSQ